MKLAGRKLVIRQRLSQQLVALSVFSNWRPVPLWFWIALALIAAFFVIPFIIFGTGGTY
jgi:hypothetical protein